VSARSGIGGGRKGERKEEGGGIICCGGASGGNGVGYAGRQAAQVIEGGQESMNIPPSMSFAGRASLNKKKGSMHHQYETHESCGAQTEKKDAAGSRTERRH
jgi:hypothetical protein